LAVIDALLLWISAEFVAFCGPGEQLEVQRLNSRRIALQALCRLKQRGNWLPCHISDLRLNRYL